MSDSYVELNPGSGGAVMDEEQVSGFAAGPATRLRSRIVLSGSLPGEVARVRNAAPASDDYGVVVRQVEEVATTATVSVVAATTDPVELGDHTDERTAMTVYNDTESALMFLKFGTGADIDSFSNVLGPGDYWESSPPRYTGIVTAVWDTAEVDGRAMVTEFR